MKHINQQHKEPNKNVENEYPTMKQTFLSLVALYLLFSSISHPAKPKVPLAKVKFD